MPQDDGVFAGLRELIQNQDAFGFPENPARFIAPRVHNQEPRAFAAEFVGDGPQRIVDNENARRFREVLFNGMVVRVPENLLANGAVAAAPPIEPAPAPPPAARVRVGEIEDIFMDEEEEEAPIPVLKKEKKQKVIIPGSYSAHTGIDVDGLLGVEIEVEGAKLPVVNNQFWTTKNDGSLRGESHEYVFTTCQSLEDAELSITSLNKTFAKKGSEVAFSFRTSVHVHVNICDLTKKELCSFLYLSHLFEDALTNYSGDTRKGNRFCLRTKDAEYKIEYLKSFFSYKGFKSLPEEHLKYSAINISAISKHGSVEFRTMRGTMDKDILFPWFHVLANLKRMATMYSVKDISDKVINNPGELIEEVFGEHLKLFEYSDMYNDLAKAYCLLIELPHIKIG